MGLIRDSQRPKLLDSDPKKVHELYEEMASLEGKARMSLEVFRESLLAYADVWMQETAKAVAIQQDQVTVRLGRQGITELKQRIRKHASSLEDRIEAEFSDAAFAEPHDASSGQVASLLERAFSRGIRAVLATLYPVLVEAGYQASSQWFDDDGNPQVLVQPGQSLELPSDLRALIERVIEIHTEVKVIESKVIFHKRARERGIAERLWDDA